MSSQSAVSGRTIPVVLLKTRSQPDDTYEEHFSDGRERLGQAGQDRIRFSPSFIPVLEHTQNDQTLQRLAELLSTGSLKREYGGMIFTSQRAVEAWADVVHRVEENLKDRPQPRPSTENDAFADLESLTSFPLYVVGPATERALQTLTTELKNNINSPFTRLNSSIHGAASGNGANLAEHILTHYNALHAEHWFTYFEAPRLPFIPLLGMSSQNYGRKRLEKDDLRLRKKPLLFLVGEVRRDVIPRTLMGQENLERRIEVEEWEVYRTQVMGGFEDDFGRSVKALDEKYGQQVRVVIVFSPQGSDVMLKAIGYLDEQGKPMEQAKRRWWQQDVAGGDGQARWVIATIGPTTRDYLKDKLGVEPDVCAVKPSPEGLRDAIEEFLREENVEI